MAMWYTLAHPIQSPTHTTHANMSHSMTDATHVEDFANYSYSSSIGACGSTQVEK